MIRLTLVALHAAAVFYGVWYDSPIIVHANFVAGVAVWRLSRPETKP